MLYVELLARELDITISQVALAWLLHRAPTVLPIPGTTSISFLEQNLNATRVALSDAQFQRFSETS